MEHQYPKTEKALENDCMLTTFVPRYEGKFPGTYVTFIAHETAFNGFTANVVVVNNVSDFIDSMNYEYDVDEAVAYAVTLQAQGKIVIASSDDVFKSITSAMAAFEQLEN